MSDGENPIHHRRNLHLQSGGQLLAAGVLDQSGVGVIWDQEDNLIRQGKDESVSLGHAGKIDPLGVKTMRIWQTSTLRLFVSVTINLNIIRIDIRTTRRQKPGSWDNPPSNKLFQNVQVACFIFVR